MINKQVEIPSSNHKKIFAKKEKDIISNIYHRFYQFRVSCNAGDEIKSEHIDNYFRQIKELIQLTKIDIENIQSISKNYSKCYSYIPENETELEQAWHGKTINLITEGVFDKELGKKTLSEMIVASKYCEENRQNFISSLDHMCQVIVISEQEWIKDKNKHKKNNSANTATKSPEYTKIYQGIMTNLWTSITSNMEITHNKIADTRSIQSTSTQASLEIILHEQSVKLTQPELKLLAVMTQQLTENGAGVLKISLQDLATKLGKKNLNKARKEIQFSLTSLMNISLKFEGKKTRFSAPLAQLEGIKDNVVFFEFSNLVQEYLLKCPVMTYDNKLLQIPSNKRQSPYAFTVGSKILYLANLNRYKNKKKNGAFIMSTESLLKTCQNTGMTNYETVLNTSHHVNKLLINPIENTLDKLVDKKVIKAWSYKNKKGELIKDYIEIKNDNPDNDSYSMEKNKKYSEWIARNVTIEMPDKYVAKIPIYSEKKANKNKKNNKKPKKQN